MNKENIGVFKKNWLLHCVAGEMLGITLAAAFAWLIWHWTYEHVTLTSQLITMAGLLLAGGLEGSILGFMQWRVLKRKIPLLPSRQWIAVTSIVAMLSWTIGMVPFFLMEENTNRQMLFENNTIMAIATVVVVGMFRGALFGLFQFIVLRHYLERSLIWVLANGFAWTMAMGWMYLALVLPGTNASLGERILVFLTSTLLAGISLGIVTGYFLMRILQKNKLL